MGEEFLLKWNDYQSSFSTMMESLCLTEEMTDCTIAVGERTFFAHRMVLSTCSPYFRSLFATVPPHLHPVVFLKDVEVRIVELLLRYMYSGQVSVLGERLVPLVQAAKSLRIKGLLDVPVPSSPAPPPTPPPASRPSPGESSQKAGTAGLSHNTTTKAQPVNTSNSQMLRQQSHPVPVRKPKMILPKTNSNSQQRAAALVHESLGGGGGEGGSESGRFLCADNPSQSAAVAYNGPVDAGQLVYPVISVEDDTSMEDDEEEGVDPVAEDSQNNSNIHSQLLQRLTHEITAYPFTGGGEGGLASPQLLLYSCEHCGKEFTSKRKHQRHVLNVHFGYNPVQCPFCQKGHRDNYNLKQHVCPVLNMKYGQFQKKEKLAKSRALKEDPGRGEALLAQLKSSLS